MIALDNPHRKHPAGCLQHGRIVVEQTDGGAVSSHWGEQHAYTQTRAGAVSCGRTSDSFHETKRTSWSRAIISRGTSLACLLSPPRYRIL
jgi:hypothetical protein